MVARLCDQL